MNLFLNRHGQSLANLHLTSSRLDNDQHNRLSNLGLVQIKKSSLQLNFNINAVYSSLMIRTIESVQEFLLIVLKNFPSSLILDFEK